MEININSKIKNEKKPFHKIKNSSTLSSNYKNERQSSQLFSDILSIPSNPEDIFIITTYIGKGAFGSVYKAIHKESKKEYAIKIISYNFNESINYQNIQQEISLMKLCESPYIIKYYGSYYSRKTNSLWLILEYCLSGSVIDLMNAMSRTLNEIELASIIEMVLYGLKKIHSLNIIHRDIKGGNILIDKNGNAKLGDFGVTVQLSENNNYRYSKKGSPYWMSPQVCSNTFYDTKTDIWSLGITCIELMEGDPPYNQIKPNLVMNLIVNQPPTGKQLFNKERLNEFKYSKQFVNFVSLCLEVDPLKRPSADELINHDFIKYFSKGNEIIKKLVFSHLDDIEKLRKEEEKEIKILKGKNINFKNKSFEKVKIDIYTNTNESYDSIGKNVIKGKNEINENLKEENNSVIIKKMNNSKNESYSDNCSIIKKNSINTINLNDNNEIKSNNSPEFMNYILNNQFIFNEDDYIVIETKNIINNDLNNESDNNINGIDEITQKINQLEKEKEEEINEYEKEIKKYKQIQKIMNQHNLKSIKEYEEFIKINSVKNSFVTTNYKSNKETIKEEINFDYEESLNDTIDDQEMECGVRNDHKILNVKSFSNYFS